MANFEFFKYFVLEWLLAVLIIVTCVWIHAQVITWLESSRSYNKHKNSRIFFVMICLIFTHITEIIIFAVGYQLILLEPGFGTISGVESPTFVDYIYYSSVVYTTLGFGDLIPQGLVRIFTSIESLTGLSLVAWSTSAAFIEIQEMNRKKSTLK